MVQPAEVREPLKFKPILQSRIWGGDGLFRVLRKGLASDQKIGEAWELSDREENATTVSEGSFTGQNLRELYARHARDILGQQYAPTRTYFPLLFKFIYAQENLSVQVHPGEGSPLGEAKTECWYILEAPPGAELILGVAGGGDREKTLAALATNQCQSVLNRVPVQSGDLFYIPAGTVHAITAGLLLYEVQQNSDTTFRLYDWDRLDASGKSRTLHVEESRQVIDLRQHTKHKIPPLLLRRPTHDEEFRVACPYFAVVKYSRCAGSIALGNRGRFRVLTCIKGSFELGWDGGQTMAVALGDTVLVPASCINPKIRQTTDDSEVLISFIPNLQAEIFVPLRAAGYSDVEIRDLGGLEGLKSS
jgi:mannose-6-phosphate isomerase